MSLKSLCYFVTLEQGKLCFFDSNYIPLPDLALNGLYAFIRYATPELLMVLGELNDHGSQHSGLDSMVQVLKEHSTSLRHHFFSADSKSFIIPNSKPTAGGGILFFKGMVVFWHLKSGSFSRENPQCYDDSSELQTLIHALGLPPERFISVKKADFFDAYCLRDMLQSDGQYPDYANAQHLTDRICRVMELPPVYHAFDEAEELTASTVTSP